MPWKRATRSARSPTARIKISARSKPASTIVGINRFGDPSVMEKIPTLKIEEHVTRNQIARLNKTKAERDAAKVAAALQSVGEACAPGINLVAPVLDAVKAYATLGEICDVFREKFGTYRETGTF